MDVMFQSSEPKPTLNTGQYSLSLRSWLNAAYLSWKSMYIVCTSPVREADDHLHTTIRPRASRSRWMIVYDSTTLQHLMDDHTSCTALGRDPLLSGVSSVMSHTRPSTSKHHTKPPLFILITSNPSEMSDEEECMKLRTFTKIYGKQQWEKCLFVSGSCVTPTTSMQWLLKRTV